MTRVASRLAYEEGIRWLAELDAMLERYRTRATSFLAAAIIAGGVGLTGLDPVEPPLLVWPVMVIGGLAATLTAAIALVWGIKGNFRLDAERVVSCYGGWDDENAVYDDLALWLAENTAKLYASIDRRRRWLYVSMVGAVAMLVGIVALRLSAAY